MVYNIQAECAKSVEEQMERSPPTPPESGSSRKRRTSVIGSDSDVCVQGSSEEEQSASKESVLLKGRVRLSLKKFLKMAGIPRRAWWREPCLPQWMAGGFWELTFTHLRVAKV